MLMFIFLCEITLLLDSNPKERGKENEETMVNCREEQSYAPTLLESVNKSLAN